MPADPTKNQLQVQMKPAGATLQPQTLQLQGLQGLTVDPSKLTVLQELPEVGKVVVQEARPQNDSISTILEEMKCSEDGSVTGGFATSTGTGGIEYTTAIPVAVSAVSSDPKKTTIKRVAAPASTVILPNNRSARNIILASGTPATLPQGAIPIKINGLNALQFPAASVKSLPQINLSNLTPCTNATTILASPPLPTAPAAAAMVAAKKTKVEVKASLPQTPLPPNLITKVVTTTTTNNNVQQQPKLMVASPEIATSLPQQPQHNTTTATAADELSPTRSTTNATNNNNAHLSSKNVGNNKTCNWVFENGEICGKTFSKSYNLVVHMRMHEDVRPFCCSLCDQTFRQKAHLQRHETTHGIGVKVGRGTPGVPGGSTKGRKRKRSRSSGGGPSSLQGSPGQVVLPTAPIPLPEHLQKRLAHVSEKFGNPSPTVTTVVTSAEGIPAIVSEGGVTKLVETSNGGADLSDDDDHLKVMQGTVVKSYSKKKLNTVAVVAAAPVGGVDQLVAAGGEVMDAEMVEAPPDATQMINSSYVEVSDEVVAATDLKDESGNSLIVHQDAAAAAAVAAASTPGAQKTILSVLLESNNPAEAITTIQNKVAGAPPTVSAGAATPIDCVKVVSQPEISSAPNNSISPEMITAISGGKVTPDSGLIHAAAAQQPTTVVNSDGQVLQLETVKMDTNEQAPK